MVKVRRFVISPLWDLDSIFLSKKLKNWYSQQLPCLKFSINGEQNCKSGWVRAEFGPKCVAYKKTLIFLGLKQREILSSLTR